MVRLNDERQFPQKMERCQNVGGKVKTSVEPIGKSTIAFSITRATSDLAGKTLGW